MATYQKNDHDQNMPPVDGLRFGIVVSAWNSKITHSLRDAALEVLTQNGVLSDNIVAIEVPGSFELTTGARFLLAGENVDAVICLGCVIKGDTRHDQYINQAVASGLTQLGLSTGRPCIFGLLTTEDEQQAIDRAGGKLGNKGAEAAETAIKMADLRRRFGNKKSSIGFGL
jgi:6,7-dimethyl-8-ribityllumazine synthase